MDTAVLLGSVAAIFSMRVRRGSLSRLEVTALIALSAFGAVELLDAGVLPVVRL